MYSHSMENLLMNYCTYYRTLPAMLILENLESSVAISQSLKSQFWGKGNLLLKVGVDDDKYRNNDLWILFYAFASKIKWFYLTIVISFFSEGRGGGRRRRNYAMKTCWTIVFLQNMEVFAQEVSSLQDMRASSSHRHLI